MAGVAAAFVVVLTFAATVGVDGQRPAAPLAIPLEPISAIIDAFRSHSVVALGEGLHGNEQGHAFRLSLIRDPRFAAIVNDIVVECGNARYQELIDRFTGGADVPYEQLRQVWQNTTQVSGVWDRPIYEDFFRAVRAVNTSLPEARRLRVLLGDPPIDWDEILRGKDEAGRWVRDRDRHAVEVIRREVLGKHRRALVIYGGGHLFRAGQSLVSQLERDAGISVFTIATAASTMYEDLNALAPNVTSWPVPSLALVRGTALDARQLVYRDAVLYLGPPSAMTFSRISSQLCSDPQYIEMRLGRFPPGERTRMRGDLMRECTGQ